MARAKRGKQPDRKGTLRASKRSNLIAQSRPLLTMVVGRLRTLTLWLLPVLRFSPVAPHIWTEAIAGQQDGAIVDAPLARLAEQLDDVFVIHPPDAPGLTFVGAMARVADRSAGSSPHEVISCGGIEQSFWPAAAACLGEAAERLALRKPPVTEEGRSRPDLEAALGRDAADDIFALAGMTEWTDEHHYVKAALLGTTSVVPVPARLVSMSAVPPAAMNVSVGCAAGPTRRDAISRALFEWVERDAVACWWHGGQPARQVSLECLDEAGVLGLVASARAGKRTRQSWFLDITSDLDIPTVACVSWTDDGKGFVHGSAARATLGQAARSAFLEACQMEVSFHLLAKKLKDRGGPLVEAERNHLQRFEVVTPQRYSALLPQRPPRLAGPADGDLLASEGLVDRLGSRGLQCLCVDLQLPDMGVPVVKTLVIGLQPLPARFTTGRLKRAMIGKSGSPMSLPLF